MRRIALWMVASLSWMASGQTPGTIDVRVFGGAGEEACEAVWADGIGVLLAGETSSDTFDDHGDTLLPGAVGRKAFIMALDTALDLQWSYAWEGDPEALPGTPSSVVVRDVVRAGDDSLMAWVLYDAPRNGHWQGHLAGIHRDSGLEVEFDLTGPGEAFTAAIVPAGTGTFLVVGHTGASATPAPPSGIQVGLWEAAAGTAPGWALVEGTAGMEALDADWHADTLYVVVHRDEVSEAPYAVLAITEEGGNPVLADIAPLADPDIALHRLTASSEGIAWVGTLTSTDGTLDAVFGKLSPLPDPLEAVEWGHDWIIETNSAADRPGRDILWTGDVLQCAGRTTTKGAGGAGAMVQTRFGPTGAWFGIHTFGGAGDEDVRDLALDPEGRLLVAGSSNSWTGLTAGNGSQDAALFRASSTNFTPGFEPQWVEVLVETDAVFVGVEESLSQGPTYAWCLPAGAAWPLPPDSRWQLQSLGGREVARGTTPGRVPDVRGSFLLEASGQPDARPIRVWIAD